MKSAVSIESQQTTRMRFLSSSGKFDPIFFIRSDSNSFSNNPKVSLLSFELLGYATTFVVTYAYYALHRLIWCFVPRRLFTPYRNILIRFWDISMREHFDSFWYFFKSVRDCFVLQIMNQYRNTKSKSGTNYFTEIFYFHRNTFESVFL